MRAVPAGHCAGRAALLPPARSRGRGVARRGRRGLGRDGCRLLFSKPSKCCRVYDRMRINCRNGRCYCVCCCAASCGGVERYSATTSSAAVEWVVVVLVGVHDDRSWNTCANRLFCVLQVSVASPGDGVAARVSTAAVRRRARSAGPTAVHPPDPPRAPATWFRG